jgi:YidC/Oxa1 family membrane protein insertase
MGNNPDIQKRVLLATVLSFVFLLGFDYFFVQNKSNQQPIEQVQQTQKIENKATTTDAPNVTIQSNKIEAVKTPTEKKIFDEDKIISTIKSKSYEYQIDSLGRISQVKLVSGRYTDENGDAIKLFNTGYVKPLEVRYKNRQINELAFKTPYTADIAQLNLDGTAKSITLTQEFSDIKITKVITFKPNGQYSTKISINNDTKMYVTPGFRPDVAVDMYTFKGALVQESDETLTLIEDEEANKSTEFKNAPIVAAVDRYYTSAFYNLDRGFVGVVDKYVDNRNTLEDAPLIFVEALSGDVIEGYIGPKDFKVLNSIDAKLTSIIEYGYITFFAKPVFTFLMMIHDYVGNWGWSIVILTLIIRLLLYPLTYKGMVSMQKLKDLAPKIKDIQEKHKNNPQKASAAMMELYKKNGANPMGGCLPLLLQIPVFFAIYRVLLNAIELKQAEWILWINDLSMMDPYFILPILMGGTMYLQQVITPNTIADPMQQKIFRLLPVIFIFFFMTFPAGLTLYWFVNNLFSLAQQYYINSIFEKKREELKKAHK